MSAFTAAEMTLRNGRGKLLALVGKIEKCPTSLYAKNYQFTCFVSEKSRALNHACMLAVVRGTVPADKSSHLRFCQISAFTLSVFVDVKCAYNMAT